MSEASRAYEDWRAQQEQQEIMEEEERTAAARAVPLTNRLNSKDYA